MADQFSRMYDVERVGGDQRTRLAEMLRANALNQPQGQMVSGWYVKPSWSQNLNQALSGALGTYMGAQLDEERKTKTAELLRDLSQGKAVEPIPAVQNFNGMEQMAEGQTPMPQQAPQNELQRLTQRPQAGEQSQMVPAMAPRQEQRYVPLTEEEKIGKVMELAQYNPNAAQIWSAQDTARQARLTRAEERELDFQRRKELLQDQIRGRQETQQLIASMRQPTGGGEDKWKYDSGSDTWVMPPNAQFPMGRSTPNVGKVGAMNNLNYLSDKFTTGWTDEKGNEKKPILETTPQGGWLGITGIVGSAIDTQAGKAFDNNVEQMSTELRKIFRIPGEGTLSDKEQAQYGIQLPKKTNSAELNAQIVKDLKVRTVNSVVPGGVNPLQSAPAGNAGGFSIRPKK